MSFIIRFQTIFVRLEYPESDRVNEFRKRYISSASEKAFPLFFLGVWLLLHSLQNKVLYYT